MDLSTMNETDYPAEGDAAALRKKGLRSLRKRDFVSAEYYLKQYTQLSPDSHEGFFHLGIVLNALGKKEEAEARFSKALALKSDYNEALMALGLLFQETGKTEQAFQCFQDVLSVNPRHPEAYIATGNLHNEKKQFDDALNFYRKALSVRPDHIEACKGVAMILNRLGKFDSAIAEYQKIIAVKADHPEAYVGIGNAYKAKGDLAESARYYQKALQVDSRYARAHLFLGLVRLLQGDFEKAWPEYEWRWELPPLIHRKDFHPAPIWDGGPLEGKKILLYPEQGYGDTIQFVRYASIVAESGGTVILKCEEKLAGLFKDLSHIDRLVVNDEPVPDIDVRASLLSLPRILGTRMENIPSETPYVFADPKAVERWKQRFEGIHALKVGIVWAGNPMHKKDHLRSVSLDQLSPLFEIPDTCFYSLQIGDSRKDLVTFGLSEKITDLSEELTDFADTAALISALDLVITVDTAPAHLAGALGTPVWTMLQFLPDWRWLMAREYSLWYPSMRLFRQAGHDDWTPVIRSVADALSRKAERHRNENNRLPEGGQADACPKCKCCETEARWFGKVDFSKSCADPPGRMMLEASHEMMDYFKCPSCGFLFSTFLDDWSFERLRERIYNPEYARIDPDFKQRRPEANAGFINRMFGRHRTEIRILDFGGGNGELSRCLRKAGFSDVVSYDPLHDTSVQAPSGKFDLVLAFEVVEHMPDQEGLFRTILSFLSNNGLFLFSTLLQPPQIEQAGLSWWYASPRNGHVSLHTQKSLRLLAAKYSLKTVSINENLHCGYMNELPEFASLLKSNPERASASKSTAKGGMNLNQPSPSDIHSGRITGLRQCRHGRMLYIRSDKYVGRSLAYYGEFSEGEVALFQQLVRPGDVVVEAGANIGAHTVFLARTVGKGGCVVAYEPQRFLHQILCANIALNELTNVYARQAGVADKPGWLTVPVPDYAQEGNFGGISLGAENGEKVQIEILDGLALPRVRMIKVDVEGMEVPVIRGAVKMIRQHRPILYVENDREKQSSELIALIQELGYRLWWHLPPLFNPANYAEQSENIFGNIVSVNLLCIPKEAQIRMDGLREVTGPGDHWRTR